MTLQTTFEKLLRSLHELREAAAAMRVSVVEDRPVVLDEHEWVTTRIADVLEITQGWVEEAIAAATAAQEAAGYPTDLDRARRSLGACHEAFARASWEFASGLAPSWRVDEIARLARRHGSEWTAWTKAVNEGLDRCQSFLHDVMNGLFVSWQEVAERGGGTSVSLQTTSIGQHIAHVPEGRASGRGSR